MTNALTAKDNEIASLRHLLTQGGPDAVARAVARREEELRILVAQREQEVAAAMARREEEIVQEVNRREAELYAAWGVREQQIREEIDDKVQWVQKREQEIAAEDERLEMAKNDVEEKLKQWELQATKGQSTWMIIQSTV